MSTTTIDENDDLVVGNSVVDTKGLWLGHPLQFVEADLGHTQRVRRRRGGNGTFIFIICNKKIKSWPAPVTENPFLITLVTQPLVSTKGQFLHE